VRGFASDTPKQTDRFKFFVPRIDSYSPKTHSQEDVLTDNWTAVS